MDIIVVSDVFGKTPALITLSNELNAIKVIDPYNGIDMDFKSESEAYSYFMEQVGLDAYLEKIREQIQQLTSTVTLIGFSICASAIWRLSEKTTTSHVNRAVCFYGSQIRNFTSIEPQFEVELVFPNSEPHFDVCRLQSYLSKKQNVTTSQVAYLHGFMNYYSNNYNQVAYKEQINRLRQNVY